MGHAIRRRNPPFPAYAEVRAALHQPWALDPHDLECLASVTHRDAHMPGALVRLSGLLLASRHGYLIEPYHGRECGVVGLLPKVLWVRPSADDLRQNLRVLHELAHALLNLHYPEHTHADVWALTLALAVPRTAWRSRDGAHHVPRWAVALRGLTARAVSRAA